jgi:hypothetical protein
MRCQTQKTMLSTWLGKWSYKSWRSLAIWMSWFPWILECSYCCYAGSIITLWGATSLCRFHRSISQKKYSDGQQYPMLPTSVYGNKIVVGYETRWEPLRKKWCGGRAVKISKSQKPNPFFGVWNFKYGYLFLNIIIIHIIVSDVGCAWQVSTNPHVG